MVGICLPLFAGGGQEEQLAQAETFIEQSRYDEAKELLTRIAAENPRVISKVSDLRFKMAYDLVDRKRYNAAMLVLTDILRTDPEQLDRIESIQRVIRAALIEYNEVYSDLIEAYRVGDLDNSYPLIKKLEELHADPNASTVAALNEAKFTAGIVYENNRFRDIMDTALSFLDQEDYWQAVGKYTEGYDLGKDIFHDVHISGLSLSIIEGEVAMYTAAVQDFLDLQLTASEIKGEMLLAVSTEDPQQIKVALGGFTNLLEAAIFCRRQVQQSAGKLQQGLLAIEKEIPKEDIKRLIYFGFQNALANGRISYSGQEGFLRSMDQFWQKDLREIGEELLPRAAARYESVIHAFDSAGAGGWDGIAENLVEVQSLLESAILLESLWGNQVSVYQEEGSLILDGEDPMMTYLPILLTLQNRAAGVLLLQSLIGNGRNLTNLALDVENAVIVEELNFLRQQIDAEQNAFSEAVDDQLEILSPYRKEQPSGIDLTEPAAAAEELLSILQEKLDEGNTLVITIVDKIAGLAYEPVNEIIANGEKYILEAETDFNGRPLAGGGGDFLARYPGKARSGLAEAENFLREGVTLTGDFLEDLFQEPDEIKSSMKIVSRIGEGRALLTTLRDLLTLIGPLMVKANDLFLEARLARQEGDDRLGEAEFRLDRGQYDRSFELLQEAAEKYDDSLTLEYDQVTLEKRNERIPLLEEKIREGLKNIVVIEVRRFIDESRTLFSQQDFQQASLVIAQASSRWENAFPTQENSEIEGLKQTIQTAVEVKSGRTLDPKDAMYTEMTQIINNARKYYLEGKEYMEGGEEMAGEKVLDRAEAELFQVQRIFAYNEEARVLSLLIQQLKDPEGFNDFFSQKFREAKIQLNQPGNEREAYIALTDLAAIYPDYPGLQEAILTAEYRTGIKEPPPDSAKLVEAAKLIKQAGDFYQDHPEQYLTAIDLLNDAIKLDPMNAEAGRLKDSILISSGETASVVMSNEDKKLFDKAIEAYQKGNLTIAKVLVDQLLTKSENRNNVKILSLKTDIEAEL